MSQKLYISSSPHIHTNRTTKNIMADVIISLLPATVAGAIIFGARALLVVAVCVATTIISEFLFNKFAKREQTIGDLSAAVTGLILGLNMPSIVPIWQAVFGSIFAIIVVKCFFGGLGCNIVNPAIAAKVFMVVTFGSFVIAGFPVDSVAGATPLEELEKGILPDLSNLFTGNIGGAIGETCVIALLLGFAYLLIKKVITWHLPVSYILTTFVLTLAVLGGDVVTSLAYVMSGGLLLGAIFMATDYVTSPATKVGKLIFGFGAGLITVAIRFWGIYPEGVSFAILLMNILNPYIEKWSELKIFGGKKA